MYQNKNAIYKRALTLAVPMMIQNGITNAVGLVDNVMVGSLGTESMTAVSIVGQLIFVFNLAVFGGLSGPGIYGAQYFGQGNIENVRKIFRLKWWIAIGCLIAGILIFLLWGDGLISLYLHGNDSEINAAETLRLGVEYLDIMLLGLLPFAITQIYATSLRETGESIKPMVAGFCSVFVDICLNYVLIYGKMGFPSLGVRGAAIATVVSRIAEMGVLILWAHYKKGTHTFLQNAYEKITVPVEMTIPVLKKGLPIFINEFFWSGGMAILTQCYSKRGLTVIAGLNISNVICNLLNVVFIAMGGAVGVLTGQMLGASEYDKAKKSALKLTLFTGVISLVITIILIAISGGFPYLYDTSEEVRSYGSSFIVITALFFPIQGILNALYFTIRSGGKTVITFLFDSVFTLAIPVPIAFCLCSYTDISILAVYTIIQSLDGIKLIVGYILFQKGVWITNLAKETV